MNLYEVIIEAVGGLFAGAIFGNLLRDFRIIRKLPENLMRLAKFNQPFAIEDAAQLTGASPDDVQKAANKLIEADALVQDPNTKMLTRRGDNQLY